MSILQDKIVLVTGAGAGIGRATALAMAAAGATIAPDAAAALGAADIVFKVQRPLRAGEGALDEVAAIRRGAVLIGVRSKVQTGEMLDVQLGASRAQFRIMWMSLSGEAGIQALAFEPPLLGIGLPKVYEMVGTG